MMRESKITPLSHIHRASAYVYLIPTVTLKIQIPCLSQVVLCGHAGDD